MGIRIERIKTIWYPNMMVSRTLSEKMIEHEHTIYIISFYDCECNIYHIDIPRWPWDSWASLGARNGRSNSSDSAAMAKGSRSLDPAMFFFFHGDSMGVPLVIIHFGVSMVHKPSSYWGSIYGNQQMGYQKLPVTVWIRIIDFICYDCYPLVI